MKKRITILVLVSFLLCFSYEKMWYFFPKYKVIFFSDKSFEHKAQMLRIPDSVLERADKRKKLIYKYKSEEIAGYLVQFSDNTSYEEYRRMYLETYIDYTPSDDMELDQYFCERYESISYEWMEENNISRKLVNMLTEDIGNYKLLYYRHYKEKDKENTNYIDRGKDFLNIVLCYDDQNCFIHIYRKWKPLS